MEISIAIHDTGINAVLERIARKGGDMTGALQIIGERILRHTDDRFTAQKDSDGKKWAALKPATLKHKKNPMISQRAITCAIPSAIRSAAIH